MIHVGNDHNVSDIFSAQGDNSLINGHWKTTGLNTEKPKIDAAQNGGSVCARSTANLFQETICQLKGSHVYFNVVSVAFRWPVLLAFMPLSTNGIALQLSSLLPHAMIDPSRSLRYVNTKLHLIRLSWRRVCEFFHNVALAAI